MAERDRLEGAKRKRAYWQRTYWALGRQGTAQVNGAKSATFRTVARQSGSGLPVDLARSHLDGAT